MIYLIAASLLWAFSFGLIKHHLAGVDPFMLAWVRLALSLVLFLPLLRLRRVPSAVAGRLVMIGSVQYGLMYISYLYAYRFMAAHEVAVFTVLTPLYVALISAVESRRLNRLHLVAALLAVLGCAYLIIRTPEAPRMWRGVALLQLSNLSFAFGQLRYRALMRREAAQLRDHDVFALLFLGGVLLASLPCAVRGWPAMDLTRQQKLVVLYLGLVPSGLGFFLWNAGARRVNAGILGVFNNVKIPLAVMVAVLLFGEAANWPRLLAGGLALFAAAAATAKLPGTGEANAQAEGSSPTRAEP